MECGEVCQYYFSIFETADYTDRFRHVKNIKGLKRHHPLTVRTFTLLACHAAGSAKAGALARDRRWLKRGITRDHAGDREGGAHRVTRSTQLKIVCASTLVGRAVRCTPRPALPRKQGTRELPREFPITF
jgi:hypothetical protein